MPVERTKKMNRTISGFSMIEILVAVLVLSIGLLGTAALMATSLRNAQSANFRTQATNLAYEIIDAMRANMANVGYYGTGTYSVPATACVAAAEPANTYGTFANKTHAADMARWARDLCYTLPNGRGRVTLVPTSTPISTGGSFRTYQATVDICWTDDRSQTASTTCATADSETLFTLTSAL